MNKFVTLFVLSLVTMSAQAIEKKVSGGVVPTHKPEVKILNLSGTVISDNKKMLTSRYMGYVKNMAVSDGDIVKKGQLLYEIDSKEIESAERQVDLSISQARLALQMNKNQYNNVLTNLARHERLYKKQMVSKYEFEMLQLAAKNLKDMV